MLRSLLVLLFLGLVPAAFGQSQERAPVNAFTSQSFQHDVRAAAMGDAGAFLPDASPLSFVQNPARLAEASVTPMLRIAGHTYQDFALDVHHVAATSSNGPIAVGAAVSRLSSESTVIGANGDVLEDGNTGDVSVLLGGAVRIGDARAHLDVGAAGRLTRFEQFVGFTVGSEASTSSQTRPSLDLGAIATYNVVPVTRQIEVGGFAPAVTASVGYTQRAIGPDFELEAQTDTFRLSQPRKASLGVSAQFSLDAQYAGGRLRVATLDIAAEALAALNKSDCELSEGAFVCEPDNSLFLGDIRPQDALLGSSDTGSVNGQKGVRLTLAETLWIAVGGLESGSERARFTRQSWGVGLSVGGALRAIGTLQNDDGALALGRRLDLTIGIARVGSGLFEDGPDFKLISVGGAVRL